MRVLFVDITMSGHHQQYIDSLKKINKVESFYLFPEEVKWSDDSNRYSWQSSKGIWSYFSMIKCIKRICKKEDIDVVHFLYGDALVRYFGIGLKGIGVPKVITMHWLRSGFLRRISYKRISKSCNHIVFHSGFLLSEAKYFGIHNAKHIEYPCFCDKQISVDDARHYWNIPKDAMVLGCFGPTSYYKGIDIVLDSIQKVQSDILLFVAGQERDFSENYIRQHLGKCAEKARLELRYLSEDEYVMAIVASDIIVLPYRNEFNGASGPMTDGVFRHKCIIGPSHGNIGHEIKEHNLGYCFTTEDTSSLAEVIDNACLCQMVLSHKYLEYESKLHVEKFVDEYHCIYDQLCNK